MVEVVPISSSKMIQQYCEPESLVKYNHRNVEYVEHVDEDDLAVVTGEEDSG